VARVNLLYNPSFRLGTAGYDPVNGATIVVDSVQGSYGPGALEVTKSGDNGSGVTISDPVSVVSGLPYAASAYVRLPKTLPASEGAGLSLSVEWRNSVNYPISISTTLVYNLEDDNEWVRLSGVWEAPVGATVAYFSISQDLGGTPLAKFLLDALLFEQANYVGGYLDNLGQAEENRIVNKALTKPSPVIFNGLELNADVILNEMIFNTIDEDGVIWICTGIEGWWGQANSESPNIPRGTEDGSYDVSGRYQARLITLTGVFYPPDRETLGAARDHIVAATNLVRGGGWLRTNESPTRAAYVRLSGQPQFSTVNARGRTEFSIGLRAGDPIKYEWNDSDPDGYTVFELTAADSDGTLINIGTADVTGFIKMTGPLGADSKIYNSLTDETLTLALPLRGQGLVGEITEVSALYGIATLRTLESTNLTEGDFITVAGSGGGYDTVGDPVVVLAASNVFPYSFSFRAAMEDEERISGLGSVSLAYDDVLVVDTYNRSVSLNGSSVGHRSKLKTMTDWLKFAPGENILEFIDGIDRINIIAKQFDGTSATLYSEDVHYLIPSETVAVSLSEEVNLSQKVLTNNVATLTTEEPHGFSIGDVIDVGSIENSVATQKSATTSVATITTKEDHGISPEDVVEVGLPITASMTKKKLASNTITITTAVGNGFSSGDSVTVALPVSSSVVRKRVASNQVTLSTSGAHHVLAGDSVSVALPTIASVVNKARSGSNAILTTETPHGFSTGDIMEVTLPTSASLTNARSMAGSAGGYLVTLNTVANHEFTEGDRITVDIGVPHTKTVTVRSASSSSCTLTIGASHGFKVGERIFVDGVDARFDGTFYITTVASSTVTYANDGATVSSTGSGGSIENLSISVGYNGSKVVNSVAAKSFTFYDWDQDEASSSTTPGTGATLINNTNVAFSGTKTLLEATGALLKYTYGGS